jgi:predicted peptidase
MNRLTVLYPLLLVAVLVITSACEKEDEIVPVKQASDTAISVASKNIPADSAHTETTIPENSEERIDSATYQHQLFGKMPYRVLFPKNYDSAKRYPLLIFLHGIGERGTDNEKQLTWGAPLFRSDSIRTKYEAIVIFPQCPVTNYWFDKSIIETLKGLIDFSIEKYGADTRKIYIGGLSMGGYGTYAMVAQYPDLFAAAIVISGDGDATKAVQMSKTRWRIFAGGKDTVVPSDKSEKMAKALKNSGASVSFTLYPQADHLESWLQAFAEPDFCSWMWG